MAVEFDFCAESDCRFTRGYAVDLDLLPPPQAPSLPHVFAFEIERIHGYGHYSKHYRPSGAEIVELLRSVWPFTVHTVLAKSSDERSEPDASYIWLLDGGAFKSLLDTGRLKAVSTRCSSYAETRPCCAGCTRKEWPDRQTLRSVQQPGPIVFSGTPAYSRLEGRALTFYLSGELGHHIDERFRIAARDSLTLVDKNFTDGHGRSRPNRYDYVVPIHFDDGEVLEVHARASRGQRRMIQEDCAAFIEAHELIFKDVLANGQVGARFVER